jgi:hypothetical protein
MIQIICPHCQASLKAPEEVLGRRVKCKKCEKPFVAQVVEEEPEFIDDEPELLDDTPTKSRKSSRPQREEEEEESRPRRKRLRDEEEEDEEPRPRVKKKKGKKKNGSPTLLYALVGGGILLLAGAGVGSYFLFFNKDEKSKTASTSNSEADSEKFIANWPELVENEGKYRIKFPSAYKNKPIPPNLKGYAFEQKAPNPQMFVSCHAVIPQLEAANLTTDQILDKMSEGMMTSIAKHDSDVQRKPINYRGIAGREFVMRPKDPKEKGTLVLRFFVIQERMIMAMGGGENMQENDPTIQGFLNSLRFN